MPSLRTVPTADRPAPRPVAPLPAPPPVPPALEDLFSLQPIESSGAGTALFWEEDAADHAFQVLEGCLRLYSILPDGRRAITGFAFSGEILGLSFRGAYPYTAEAITGVRFRRLGQGRLAAAGGSDVVRPQLLARIYDEICAAQRLVVILGQLNAEERVASFLLSAAVRTGADRADPVAVELPMSRLDVADHLGLTIETVCRVFSKLKRDGLLRAEGRHRVLLPCIQALRVLAGEESGTTPSQPSVSVRHAAVWPQRPVFIS